MVSIPGSVGTPQGHNGLPSNRRLGRLADAHIDAPRTAPELKPLRDRAEVSHGAPLRHLPSLANLLANVSAEGFRQLRQATAADAHSAGPSAPDRLAAGLRAYCRFALEQPGLLTLMFRWDLVDLQEPQLAADSPRCLQRPPRSGHGRQAEGWHSDLEAKCLAGALCRGPRPGQPMGRGRCAAAHRRHRPLRD
jgi:AcrR family transcriptional regulator